MSYYPSARTRAGQLSSGLLSKVFGLLSFSLAFAAVGGAAGWRLNPGWILPLMLVEIGLIIGVNVAREKEGLNLLLLYGFTFVSGLTLGPILAAYTNAGLGGIVLEAAAVTAVMTVGLSAYALTTKRDFSGLAPYLFMGLLGLFVALIIGLFVGGIFQALIGFAGALIFSGLLIVDVQRAKSAQDTMGNAVVITLGIYLDIVNLFLYILRILSYFQGGSRR
jgi:FtsH-binding integral membrane protein